MVISVIRDIYNKKMKEKQYKRGGKQVKNKNIKKKYKINMIHAS